MKPIGHVYEIQHPTLRTPVYVGETVRDIAERLYEHIGAASRGVHKNKQLEVWIRTLQTVGLSPLIHLVEEVFTVEGQDDNTTLLHAESEHIDTLRAGGHELFNGKSGVRNGHVFAEGTGPRKLKGRKRPVISAALTGRAQDPEGVAKRAESMRATNDAKKESGKWDSEEERAMRSERVRRAWAKRKENKLLRGGESDETRENRRLGQIRRQERIRTGEDDS